MLAEISPHRLLLPLLVLGSVLLAAAWALYVPMFEGADENEQFAYVVAIYAAGRPLNGGDSVALTPGRVLPDPAYLERGSGFFVTFGHPEIKAPVGYGSIAYFQALDRGAHQLESTDELLHPRQVMVRAPIGYYGLAAAWMGLVSLVVHSPSALFFAARFFNVLLLVPALLLTYGIARGLRLRPAKALAVTAIAGLLPVATFSFSTVQPDALGGLLVLACLYSGQRYLARPASLVWPAVFGLALGLQVITKAQYWAITVLAIGALAAVELLIRRRGRPPGLRIGAALLLAGIPTLVLWAVNVWTFRGAPPIPVIDPAANASFSSYAALHHAVAGGPLTVVRFLAVSLGYSLVDIFFTGAAHGFWGFVDWTDAPLRIGPPQLNLLVAALLWAGTLLVLPLSVWRLGSAGVRLARIARRRGAISAMRIAAANPAVNAYLLFTLLVIGLDVATATTFTPQGRYWIAVLPGFVIFAALLAPRAVPRRPLALALSRLLLGGMTVYVLAAAAFSLPSFHARYYGTGRQPATVSPDGLRVAGVPARYRLELVGPASAATGPLIVRAAGAPVTAMPGDQVGVAGWAADPTTGRPGAAVFIVVDGQRRQQAVYGDDPPLPGAGDPALAHSGFDAIIDTTGLSPGRHSVAVEVAGANGVLYPAAEAVSFDLD